MSTTKPRLVKAVKQLSGTYVSSPQALTGVSLGSLTTASSNGIVRAKHFIDSEITTAMLESEAFTVPVNRLIDVWITRFGNKWVNLEEIEEDEFFSNAFKRLKQLGEVEVHFLTDRARYVCRMPEQ